MNRFVVVSSGLYVLLIAAILFGLLTARTNATRHFDNDAARRDWQAWRDDAQPKDFGRTSVSRSTPRSAEPPTLVLLRDHFAVCLTGSVVITSALFWSLALLAHGAFTGPQFPIDSV